MPYITSGQLKSLAVSTAKRSSALPNVPTVAETGIGDFDLALWIGVFVPRATPRAVWEQAVSSNAHDNAGAALIGVARKLLDHPGLRHLLSTGHTGRVWVKRCGAYSKWGWTCRRLDCKAAILSCATISAWITSCGEATAAHTVRKRGQVSHCACEPGCPASPSGRKADRAGSRTGQSFQVLRFSSALRPSFHAPTRAIT
jgi:hypothetical protein